MTDQPPRPGDRSPWGVIISCEDVAPGVYYVSTASHGGIWLSPERLAIVPADYRAYAERWAHGWGPGWFEEDVAASAVVATFPELFTRRGQCWPHVQADALNRIERALAARKVAQ